MSCCIYYILLVHGWLDIEINGPLVKNYVVDSAKALLHFQAGIFEAMSMIYLSGPAPAKRTELDPGLWTGRGQINGRKFFNRR